MEQATKPPSGKQKKVLFLITKGTQGGAQKYVYDLCTSLGRDAYEPLVAFGMSGKLVEDLAAQKITTYEIPSLNRDVGLFSDIQAFFQIRRLIRKIRPDVVHVNSSKAAGLGALAARAARVPKIIFTVHGWPFKEDRGVFFRAFILVSSWVTGLLADTIIVVSTIDKDLGERMWFLQKKIQYVPLGIVPPSLINREAALYELRTYNQNVGKPDGSVHIGTIAELTPNKGLQRGIKAIALLNKAGERVYSYTIIGDGEERKTLQELANSLGEEEHVHFTGFVPNAASYMETFDVFLLPSQKEGMPYVLLESGEAGIPTVTTKVINPDLAEKYKTIIQVETVRAKEIASAIEEANTFLRQRPTTPKFPLQNMLDATIALYV